MTIYLFIDLPFSEIGSKSTFPREQQGRAGRKGEKGDVIKSQQFPVSASPA